MQVETLDVWSNLQQAPKSNEAISIHLTRIERNTEWMQRNQAPLREVLARMVRYQFVTGAMNPATIRLSRPQASNSLLSSSIKLLTGSLAMLRRPPTIPRPGS